MRRLVLALTLLLPTGLAAQELTPRATFLADSIGLGDSVRFSLSLRLPSSWQVLFPDSTHFEGFEVLGKEVFASQQHDTTRLDSAHYWLRTWSIDPVQGLAVPVRLLWQGDTVLLTSNADSIAYRPQMAELPSPPLPKAQPELLPVNLLGQWPWAAVLTTVGLVVVAVVLFLLRKRLYRRYQVWRLQWAWRQFKRKFPRHAPDVATQDQGLHTWKLYLARLSNQPLASYTAQELAAVEGLDGLATELDLLERNLYGPQQRPAEEAWQKLLPHAAAMTERRKKTLLSR